MEDQLLGYIVAASFVVVIVGLTMLMITVAVAIFEEISKLKGPATPPTVLHAIVTFGGKEVTKIMLTDIQTGLVAAEILDADGNPAVLPAGVTWSWASDNTAIATVAPNPADPSGLSNIVTPNPVAGNLGTCNLNGASSDGLVKVTIACQVVASAATQATATLTAQ